MPKKTIYILHFLFFLTLFFYACQKDVELNLPPYNPQLVIEGNIESGQPAMVFISRNSAYFGKTDSLTMAKMLLVNASVMVSDGAQTDILEPAFNLNYFPPFFYKGKMKGEIGKTYTLTVVADGNTYQASTSIIKPIKADSAWFKLDPPDQDSFGYVWARFTDPSIERNFYRIFSKRFHQDSIFIPVLGSVYEDRFFNGKTFNFSVMRGNQFLSNTKNDKNEKFGQYKLGDTILLKISSIDEAHFNFWRTVEQEMYSGGNPFSSPIPIISNINNALGVWGGYGSSIDTIIAK